MMHLNLFLRSLVLLGVLMGSGDALAQRDFIEQLRSDLRAEKVAVLSESMELEEAESEKFWPVYREYELELWKLGDRRLALLKRYAQEYESLGNAEVKSIAQDWFELREDQLELERKVFERMEKELSASIAARFVQVEHQIGLLVELGQVEETPLVSPIKK